MRYNNRPKTGTVQQKSRDIKSQKKKYEIYVLSYIVVASLYSFSLFGVITAPLQALAALSSPNTTPLYYLGSWIVVITLILFVYGLIKWNNLKE